MRGQDSECDSQLCEDTTASFPCLIPRAWPRSHRRGPLAIGRQPRGPRVHLRCASRHRTLYEPSPYEPEPYKTAWFEPAKQTQFTVRTPGNEPCAHRDACPPGTGGHSVPCRASAPLPTRLWGAVPGAGQLLLSALRPEVWVLIWLAYNLPCVHPWKLKRRETPVCVAREKLTRSRHLVHSKK